MLQTENNICFPEKYTKRGSVLQLRLVYFSLKRTLHTLNLQYLVFPSKDRKSIMHVRISNTSSLDDIKSTPSRFSSEVTLSPGYTAIRGLNLTMIEFQKSHSRTILI